MAADKQTLVVGLFRDHTLANQAIDELRGNEWANTDNQVRLVSRSSNGIFDKIRHSLTERESSGDQVTDELSRLDLPVDQHQHYQRELENGAYLVIAHPYGHQLEARDIMHRYGAYDVFMPLELGGERSVQLLQEVPQVQKHVVEVGEIRIHKRVITEERTFTVPVTREEVTIERLPLQNSGQQTPSLQANVTDQNVSPNPTVEPARALPREENETLKEAGELRILVREEQVIIQKQPIVVEEIVIQKHLIQETRQLVEPIKHEEARIERIGNAPIRENQADSTSPAR